MRRTFAFLALSLCFLPAAFAAESRPKVRAITAFIRIDAKSYEAQIGDAVKFLNAAREEYRASGFEVETIRVVTQPLGEYIKGMNHADAVALLRKYGDLAAKLGFSPNMGAIMVNEDDSRA